VFNRENDLLFTCAKDKSVMVWFTSNGERLGTYDGHSGAVNHCDVTFDSHKMISASADMSAKLWDVYSGKCLFTFPHTAPVRHCMFATGDSMALTVQLQAGSAKSRISIWNISDELTDEDKESLRDMDLAEGSFTRAVWAPLNSHIYSGDEDGYVRIWDVSEGKQTFQKKVHKRKVSCLAQTVDRNLLLTASADMTACLIDMRTPETVLKTYVSDRPLNACAFSPILNHVLLAGGQEAQDVTMTSSKEGHFEVDFWHIFYEERLASVRGHFGPVNALAVSPNGKMFASAGEDGYVRLHHFDSTYLNSTY